MKILTLLLSVCTLICLFQTTICTENEFTFEKFYEEAIKHEKQFTQHRRNLHTIPETAFNEFKTSKYVQNFLKENDIQFTTNWGVKPGSGKQGNGIVAQIGTGESPCIAIRADMDALPMQETTNVTYVSTHPGVMHACAHDAHMTILMYIAYMMKGIEDKINGTVKFVFQPAEEGGPGAKYMVEEGVITQTPPIEMMFGYHMNPSMPSKKISTTPSIMSSSVTDFYVTIKGRGGHAALHHLTIDPVPAGAAVVRSFYDMYAREMYFQTDKAAVITVSNVETTPGPFNAIPDNVYISGTIRAPYEHTMTYVITRMKAIVEGIATSYNTGFDIHFTDSYPPLCNTQETFDFFINTMKKAGITDIHEQRPQMSGEDFAFFAKEIPTFYAQIGIGSSTNPDTNKPLHTTDFAMDDTVMPYVASMYAFMTTEAIASSK